MDDRKLAAGNPHCWATFAVSLRFVADGVSGSTIEFQPNSD
jgi:hypothetical protein